MLLHHITFIWTCRKGFICARRAAGAGCCFALVTCLTWLLLCGAQQTSLECWNIEGMYVPLLSRRGFTSSSGFDSWEDAVGAGFSSTINAQASCWEQPVLPWQD